MASKIDRATHGPGLGEVVLGTSLSICLGGLLAAFYLVLKPVEVVKAIPEEPEAEVIYFIEGSKLAGRGNQWQFKKQALVSGRSGTLSLSEDELNAWISAGLPTAQQAAGGQPGEAGSGFLSPSTPNFRIRDDVLQLSVQTEIRVVGLSRKVIAQARGGFQKGAASFAFSPDEFYLGSLPLHQLGGVADMAFNRLAGAFEVPEDVRNAWAQLVRAEVEGNTVQLTAP